MKRVILAGVAALGLSVLLAGVGPVFAGGNDPQDHWAWQYEEAIETGTLTPSDVGKQAMETDVPKSSQAGADVPAADDWRWKESGGE